MEHNNDLLCRLDDNRAHAMRDQIDLLQRLMDRG